MGIVTKLDFAGALSIDIRVSGLNGSEEELPWSISYSVLQRC